jgi:Arc/MetJ-type ribon-helix-helix transcriptional regulator
MAIQYKKESIHATVSPYIKKQAEELVASGDFSSMSDLVSVALAEFIGHYKREQKEKDMGTEELLSALSEKDLAPAMIKILKTMCEEGKLSKNNFPIIVDNIIE